MKNEDLYVYKKSDFYEDYISSQKEYYEREQVDTLLAEKDKEIALLKEHIANGDVSRLTWIDDCIDKDKEIAELKKKLMPCINGDCILTCEVVEKYGKENADLKAKLEDVQASAYADSVDAGMRERRLRRALWIARARSAHNAAMMWEILSDEYLNGAQFTIDFRCVGEPDVTEFQMFRGCMDWMKIYENVERKCLKKAEEYK